MNSGHLQRVLKNVLSRANAVSFQCFRDFLTTRILKNQKRIFKFADLSGVPENLKLSPLPKASTKLPEANIMMYSHRIFPRKGKMKADIGMCPLYLRIICGERIEVSLNKRVNPQKWNSKSQRLVGNTPEAKAINDFIKSVEVRLHNIHTSLLNKGEFINAEILKANLLGKTGKHKTVLEAFDYHIRHNEKNYSTATLKKYGYCRDHLKNYIWKCYQTSDVFLSKVDLPFIKEFQLYLSELARFIE